MEYVTSKLQMKQKTRLLIKNIYKYNMGRKKKAQQLSVICQNNCGKIYEHECINNECKNIINAHKFVIDSVHNVPICFTCKGNVVREINKKKEFTNKSIGTQCEPEEQYTIEDPEEYVGDSETNKVGKKNIFTYLFCR